MNDDEWMDTSQESIPSHLCPPEHLDYLMIVDITSVHFIEVNYCKCNEAMPNYLQLLRSKLFPATLQQPRTAFTFNVLDNFIQDNLKCGTSRLNYFSKLRHITFNAFPHLVPDWYRELLRVVRKWWLLKLLKWNGFSHCSRQPREGELALFCLACPQPGLNYELSNQEYSNWKYTHTFIMDGNFKAEHMYEKRPGSQVWLMDGLRYMVACPEYKEYLKNTYHPPERSMKQPVLTASTSYC
ncbi:hypothetical protein OG21DRAFT_1488496 [Imleria badia]|nr:hypothetical protein OG21DRAFT_1488496 [Imleria badia]